ncbi:MAG: hypothetical protein Q7R72_01880 [bacterium]|nr:hypothetical protein [bacterium]
MKTRIMSMSVVVLFVAISSITSAQTTGFYISSSAGSVVGQGITGFATGGSIFGNSYDGRLKVGIGNYSALGDLIATWGITTDFPTITPVFNQTYTVTNFQTSTFDTVGQQKPALGIESLQYDNLGFGHWISPDFVTGSYKILEFTTDGTGNLLSGAIDAIQYEGSSSEYTFVSWRLNSSVLFASPAVGGGGGGGGSPIIPEPSTYATIAGLSVLVIAFINKKRRKSAS